MGYKDNSDKSISLAAAKILSCNKETKETTQETTDSHSKKQTYINYLNSHILVET